MAIFTGNSYTANHHLDLFANHGCGLLCGGVACEFTRKSCIVQGIWPDFVATFKICKKSNFDLNQLKLSEQHKYMYMYQKKL